MATSQSIVQPSIPTARLYRLLLPEAHGLFHGYCQLLLQRLHVLVRRQIDSVKAVKHALASAETAALSALTKCELWAGW